MSSPKETRQWILACKPSHKPILSGPDSTFKLITTPLPLPLRPNQILVKTVYLSNDPAQRGWIDQAVNPKRLYRRAVEVNDVVASIGIAEVLESTDPDIQPGTYIQGYPDWTEYSVLDTANLAAQLASPVRADALPNGLDLTHFISTFGTNGMTAYQGLFDIAKVKPEDIVVVSSAAGATGSIAVQICKNMVGCRRVIGIAGGEKKCRRVVEELGADVCLDYKRDTFADDLARETGGDDDESAFPTVYFDNVGGNILDLMLTRMAREGRIAACGAISNYNRPREKLGGMKNWVEVITMRLMIKGFIILDLVYAGRIMEAVGYLIQGVQEGKIRVGDDSQEVVKATFEDVPRIWLRLFEGEHRGKLITQLVS